MKTFDDVKKHIYDKRIQKLTQKRQKLTDEIYELDHDIIGFRQDEMYEQEKESYGEPVDEFILKNATKFRQRAEMMWVNKTIKREKTEARLEKLQQKRSNEPSLKK
ncbi:MAG: hypothetical protein IJ837_02805 [Clostridia bacterium]|nr:hypothetical protein [Clostridia bacterium]